MAALQVTPVGPAGLKAAGGDAAGGERLAVMRLAVMRLAVNLRTLPAAARATRQPLPADLPGPHQGYRLRACPGST